jgi:hypothetical protein
LSQAHWRSNRRCTNGFSSHTGVEMTKMTPDTESQLLRRVRRAVLGVVAFQIAIAIVVLGVINGEVPLAVTSVTCLIVIAILALAFFRRLGRHLYGTER